MGANLCQLTLGVSLYMKAVSFTNWTDQDFTYTWDKMEFTFQAGQSIYIQDFLAYHFAKHLIDRELNENKLPTNHQSREELLKKCIGEHKLESTSSVELETQILNVQEEIEKENKPRRGRPAKQEKSSEEEFEDLKSK